MHALARELLGSYYKNAVLELNASDARGIDVRYTFIDLLHYTKLSFFVLSLIFFVMRFLVVTFYIYYEQFIGGTESN